MSRPGALAALLSLLALAAVAPPAPAQQPMPSGASAMEPDLPPRESAAERRVNLERPVTAPRELAGPVDPANYRLGPGDLLLLTIRGQVSRNLPVEVGPEGTVLIPDDGVVNVAGRTLTEVRVDILQRVHRLYRNIEADLRLSRPRVFRVYVTGQVKTAGPTSVNGSYRVADVLTDEMFLEGASRRRIELLHTDGTRELCDLALFLQTGDAGANPWLRDGDVVQVPTATRFVYVSGAVARPGKFELGQRDSLHTLLTLSGGVLPSALLDRLLLVRFPQPVVPESLWVSYADIASGSMDLPVDDGVRLYVYYQPKYRLQNQASILGEIQRPGAYPIVEGRTRLSELVSAAEGFQADADLSAIRVHRASTLAAEKDPELERLLRLSRSELTASEYEVLRTKLAGLREDYRVNWARLKESPDVDLLLRDGDIVRVERLVSSIRVDGEVRRPGLLNYIQGESVDDVVVQAGGFTNRAWRGKVRVTRAVTGQTLLARNVRTLDPGDFVWVPERSDITQWDRFKEVLTVVTQVATIVIAIRSLR